VGGKDLKAFRSFLEPERGTADELAGYRAFKAAIGDTPWDEVPAVWKEHRAAPCSRLCRDALLLYLTHLDAEIEAKWIVAGTRARRRQKSEMLCAVFGERRLDELSDGEISEWLDASLAQAGLAATGTFNSYLKSVSDFFELFVSSALRRSITRTPAVASPWRRSPASVFRPRKN